MSTAVPDLRGRMYRDRRLMQPQETTEFLRRQKVANVGTVDAHGRPYVVPLVYIYEGGDLLYLHTGDHQGHFLTNVQNNPRICVEVSEIGDLHSWQTVRLQLGSGVHKRGCIWTSPDSARPRIPGKEAMVSGSALGEVRPA